MALLFISRVLNWLLFTVSNGLGSLITPCPEVIKLFFMLNSTEHGIFMLINVKMPTTFGILTFMSGKIAS